MTKMAQHAKSINKLKGHLVKGDAWIVGTLNDEPNTKFWIITNSADMHTWHVPVHLAPTWGDDFGIHPDN